MPALLLQGIVTKVGYMNKTATVSVSRCVTHPRTKKRMDRVKKYLTHDPDNVLRMSDEVTIKNVPPISARKRFALYKILHSPEAQREERHRRDVQAQAQDASVTASAVLSSLPSTGSSTEQTVRA